MWRGAAGSIPNPMPSGLTIPSPTFTGTAGFADGTASLPSIYWTSDADGSNTGFYRQAANATGVATNGTLVWLWNSGGNFTPGSDATRDIGTSALRVRLTYSATLARAVPVTETGSTHTVAATTSHLICNRAGDVTVTLPTASSFPGRELFIRTIQAQTVTSNAANVVPRTGGAAGTAILAATDGAWTLLVSDGTNWESMAGTP